MSWPSRASHNIAFVIDRKKTLLSLYREAKGAGTALITVDITGYLKLRLCKLSLHKHSQIAMLDHNKHAILGS